MNLLLVLIRAVQFGSCLILMSVFAVFLLVAKAASAQAAGAKSYQPCWRLASCCLVAAFVSGFLWLWFAISGMSGSPLGESLHPGLFTMVLTQTEPGHIWMVRAITGLLMAGVLIWIALSRGASPAIGAGVVLSAILAASLAWNGHAGAGQSRWQSIHLAADVVHLIVAGLWPSGLLPFAILLSRLTNSTEPGVLDAARVATRRFSAMSLVAVTLVVLTGTMNSLFLVGSFRALVTTEYGRILLLKLSLFAIACGVGACNLLLLKPRLTIDQRALGAIKRNVWIEFWIGILIVIVVGWLGITPPAAS